MSSVLLHRVCCFYIRDSFSEQRHRRRVQISTLIGQIVPCRVISLMLMAFCCLLITRTALIICRNQCLGDSGSISTARS